MDTYSLPLCSQLVVVCVIESGVVDHRGDDEVDVDPECVVKHEPDESQESEDISDGQPGRSIHLHNLMSFTKYVCLDNSR